MVMKQDADMLDDPSVVYENTSTIRGVAIHVASAQLFISDSLGYVYRTSITKRTTPTMILSPSQVNFKPLSLSVDWLNLHLYILGEVKHATTVWQIARCNLDGRGLTVAVAGFLTRPTHIEVDPYNGYLFWVTRGGLYRLDLADISNGVKHEVRFQRYMMRKLISICQCSTNLLPPSKHSIANNFRSIFAGSAIFDSRRRRFRSIHRRSHELSFIGSPSYPKHRNICLFGWSRSFKSSRQYAATEIQERGLLGYGERFVLLDERGRSIDRRIPFGTKQIFSQCLSR